MPIGGDEQLTFNINFFTNATPVLQTATRQVDRFVSRTNASLARSQGTFKSLRGGLEKTGLAVNRLAGRWIAMGATFASTFAIFKSISDAQKFGIAIAEIGTIFSGTGEELEAVEKNVLSFSKALGLPEEIVAKGFYQIISADITDAADAMVVLDASTKLATVGLADVKQTIDVVTSVIKAYTLDVGEAGRITDVLFQTVIKGKTTIPELSQSLGQVLPIAATLGVRLEEVAAAIATLTQSGIETNTAVIQLRQTFNALLKPSAEATKTLALYGIEISQARLQSEGFGSILEELRRKLGNNASAYSKIFGNIRALIPILALTGAGFDQFNAVVLANDRALGKVQSSLDRFLRNPFKQFSRFFTGLRIELLKIGSSFITTFVQSLEDNGGLDEVVDRFRVGFSGFDEVAKGVAKTLGALIAQWTGFLETLGGKGEAEEFFRSIGKIVGDTGRLIVTSFGVGIALAIKGVIELAKLFDDLVASIKTTANEFAKATAIFGNQVIDTPFPEFEVAEKLSIEIDDMERQVRRGQELLADAFASERKLDLSTLIFGEGDTAQTLGKDSDRIAKNVALDIEALEALRLKQEEVGTRRFVETADFASIEQFLEGFMKITGQSDNALGDLIDSFVDFGNQINGVGKKLSGVGGDAVGKGGVLDRVIDPSAAANRAREAAVKAAEAFQSEFNLISATLTGATGTEVVPITFLPEFSPFQSANTPQEYIAALKEVFSRETGIELPVLTSVADIEAALANQETLSQIQGDLAAAIDQSGAAEIAHLEKSFRLRRDIFEAQLLAINANDAERAAALKGFDDLELAQRRRIALEGQGNAFGNFKDAGGSSFGGGLQTTLLDIQANLDDLASRGARVAEDITGAFRDGFRSGISDALLGEGDALERAREVFARGLADAFANALADQLTSFVTSGLSALSESIFGAVKAPVPDPSSLTQLQASNINLLASDQNLAAAIINAKTATAGVATSAFNIDLPVKADAAGDFTQPPFIQGFAAGTQTIPKRLTEIGAGGVKSQELLTRVREGHQNEAVVPLPGNGRSIPVEFRNPAALSSMGGSTIVNQEAHLHLNVTSDDRSFTQKVAEQMPVIERMLTATLSTGGNRALEGSVRSAAR